MDAGTIVIYIVAFLFALSFHEAAHAWTSDRLGDPTARMLGRVTMNPIAHIDPIMTILFPALLIMAGMPPFGAAKPVPVDTRNLARPRQDHAWIAAAGPISNVILTVIAIVLIRLIRAFEPAVVALIPISILGPLLNLLVLSVVVNLILATFNMIPLPPLDGSWILRAVMPGGAVDDFYRQVQPYGFLILMLLIWMGAFRALFTPVIALGFALAGLR